MCFLFLHIRFETRKGITIEFLYNLHKTIKKQFSVSILTQVTKEIL
jgi:hypothetical protein